MTAPSLLEDQRRHLASLLEAIQRCVYFLDASTRDVSWPLTGQYLDLHKKDNALYEALAAVNERFAKLQDTLGSAMRHSLVLSGEQADSFIKILAMFEKLGVIASIEAWQLARTARNLAAHDYETDYDKVALHFNTLRELTPDLFVAARRFVDYCAGTLNVNPLTVDFEAEFMQITSTPLRCQG
jgi:hypothetical protein